jgi:excisionase family DNA binding protein
VKTVTIDQLPRLTVQDMIELFNVDRSTIYEWRKAGLPYYKLGGSVRFNESEVLAWIEKNKVNKN